MTAGKRIGILTSGGDCAGLNAVIRAVVHRAVLTYGWQVLGIKEGTQGLLQRPVQYQVLDLPQVDGNMMRMGGTILGTTNRGDPFAYPMADGTQKDRSDEIIGGYRELGLDALIGIGGDGSFAILKKLADKGGFQMVGIPKTIDNDLGLTEVSVGYDTAVGVAVEALDRLQPTAASHARVMVLEVMGRDAGHIALAAGIAGGADVVLIPEIPYSIESIARKIKQVRSTGRNFALVVVSEAVKTADGTGVQKLFQGGQKRYGGIGDYIGEKIAEATGAETRVTVLGHVQRGSMPSPRDRLVASAFGVHAVDLIAEGKFDRMVAWSDRGVIDVPITEAIAKYACVELDGAMVKTARGLGISLGD
ncbi:6-phosphofructokinase [Azospirillum sp. TSH58]|uniref:ATP-dependent 6-phosphofructokinase n=1 Tax=Azospirillum sp. TSH58 TaxID=664962 RepID=UPI000D600DB4|nr:ATP-dependent 6-phosphofructokinase [Azospirillum sp. TSH58]AWJ83282.1 6-phosphofructokinase [Azospirillum sp. TSH58]PWC80258.1 6-phosphofructokinase [Azospirillum sp. TSH58]